MKAIRLQVQDPIIFAKDTDSTLYFLELREEERKMDGLTGLVDTRLEWQLNLESGRIS